MAKILIVEDYPSLQRMYSMALGNAGYDIVIASDGKEAEKMAIEEKPNLILLDLLMPNVNGLEFLHSFRKMQHADTKIIVFSNMDTPALKQQVLELGISHYLIKSDFTPSELLVIIEKTLKEKA